MVADVQNWLDNPAADFGWLISADNELTLTTAKRFDARENPTLANRPVLNVTYTPVPEPTTVSLALVGLCGAAWLAARRRRRS